MIERNESSTIPNAFHKAVSRVTVGVSDEFNVAKYVRIAPRHIGVNNLK